MEGKIKRFFSLCRLLVNRHRIVVPNSNRYFFIIGSGRCGSTLLRVILERHDDIAILPEINAALPKSLDFYTKNAKLTNTEYFDQFYTLYRQQHAWDDSLFKKKELSEVFNQMVSTHAFPSFLESLFEIYKKQNKPDARLLGDKNPYLTFFIPNLSQIFPKAKFIHLVRDGRDVAASWHYTKELSMNLLDAAKRWNWSLKEVERFRFLIKDRLLEIKYEDLVTQAQPTTKLVCDFLNIRYNNSMLDNSYNHSSGEVSKGHHFQSTNLITTHSIGKWEQRLSLQQIKEIEPILKKRLSKYNYLS